MSVTIIDQMLLKPTKRKCSFKKIPEGRGMGGENGEGRKRG